MSALPTSLQHQLFKEAETKAILEAKNKAAAKEQLLRIQLILAKRPIGSS